MRAPTGRKVQVVATAVLGMAATYALWDEIEAYALPSDGMVLADQVGLASSDLPRDLRDGTVLDAVSYDGRLVTYHHHAGETIDVRDAYNRSRNDRCAEWRRWLRGGEVAYVEYRYQSAGSTSSYYLSQADCR